LRLIGSKDLADTLDETSCKYANEDIDNEVGRHYRSPEVKLET
jgi:hypothetical protein